LRSQLACVGTQTSSLCAKQACSLFNEVFDSTDEPE
jgi:hypothetical protein